MQRDDKPSAAKSGVDFRPDGEKFKNKWIKPELIRLESDQSHGKAIFVTNETYTSFGPS